MGARDGGDWTPLSSAATPAKWEVVRYLFDRGATDGGDKGCSLLHMAAARGSDSDCDGD